MKQPEKVKLGVRLKRVAEMAGRGRRMADIGSDHALLPRWMLQENRVESAIAGELGDGPFNRAREAAEAAGLSGRLEVRQGDGLTVLTPGEVETVVIAGMGGDLIAEILSADPAKSSSFSRYVLQPMKHEAVLRRWLADAGWPVLREELIQENGKYYVLLEARPGREPYSLTDLEILLGPSLLASEDPEVLQWLRLMQEKYGRIARQVAESRTASQEEQARWREWAGKLRQMIEQKEQKSSYK